MKILVIAKLFVPLNTIGAIRPYNFAKELSANGVEVTCVTSELEIGKTDLDFSFNVCRVPGGKVEAWNKRRINQNKTANTAPTEAATTTKKPSRAVAFLRRTAAQVIGMIETLEWSKNATKKCLELIKQDKPDLILTTYGPIDTVLVGLKLKRKCPDVQWVSDIRDALDASQVQFWRVEFNKMVQRRMLKTADVMITVSKTLSEKYSLLCHKRKRNVPIYVIPNGYEETPALEQPANDGILRIGYTGDLYGGLRKMDAVFEALSLLEKESGKPVGVEVHYAGVDGVEVMRQAEKYGAQKYVTNYGMIERKKALSLQEKCDVLCVVSWNTKTEKGIITGKFPEYLRLKKPVLALISGEVPGAELTEKINELRVGFSYEYVKRNEDFENLVEWLRTAIDAKIQGKDLCPDIDLNSVEEYAYSKLSMSLLEKLDVTLKK